MAFTEHTMKLSIFTPTHDPKHLLAAYESITANSYEGEWEWVILRNGAASGMSLPAVMADDDRVRLFDGPAKAVGIGALKKQACTFCTGSHFIELDHDDMLFPHALQAIAAAIDENPNAGFLYSDDVCFYSNGSSHAYPSTAGWESYKMQFKGRPYTAMRAFEPTAASLHLIYFAPDHVRVWSREAYEAVGGHDSDKPVGDDHDLLCRTYLAGFEFVHIQDCLYMYRLQDHGQNTFLIQNDDVQAAQQKVSNTYTHQLVEEWCRREELPRIDLGGAHNSPEGYQSVDLRDADHCVDIMQDGLPFEDNSVGCVRAADFLEHIPHCNSRCDHGVEARRIKKAGGSHGDVVRCTVAMMNEIYRVLVPGGWLLSQTPSSDGRGAFQDPTHVSFWNPNSFWYYTRRQQAQFVDGITCRFAPAGSSQNPRIWQAHPSEWHRQHEIPYVFADLIAIKDQRHPGGTSI
jgi:glycosyltransferase involved in cell wall biosynthesis